MSEMAIAAVTATLRAILFKAADVSDVTTLPPDRANQGVSGQRLNLFLYHVSHNAAWRNQVVPTRVKAGETGHPPLALTLHYLLTAYDDDQGDESDHTLLGKAMLSLHDKPVISRDQIQDALSSSSKLSTSRLDRQFEPVRLTPETLSVDEMSKLWTTFQTQYRVSTSYQASVVLLESRKPTVTPLPVLKRGPQDRGPQVEATMPARLTGVEYRDARTQDSPLPAAQLGDTITLVGTSLPAANGSIVVRNPQRRPTPAEPEADLVARLKPAAGSNQDKLYVVLDELAGNWVSGPLQILVERPRASGRPRRSAPIYLALAPTIRNESGLTARITVEPNGRKMIVQTSPPIARQRDGSLPEVMLLLTPTGGGDVPNPILAEKPVAGAAAAEVKFDVTGVPPGGYRVRLRIDAVETLPMTRNGTRMDFDDLQTVRL
jgi:hypothetical protein